MKHSEWLRLKAKGDEIVATLRTQGYQSRKQTHRLSWHLRKGTIADTPSLASPQSDRFWLQDNYPWIIVRLLPNAQHYVVGRFYSRSEAENHQRVLRRFMPAAEFEVTFEPPSAVATDRPNEILV